MTLEDGFKDAPIPFLKNIEIFNVRSTESPNIIQLIAKDNRRNILIVLSWDFENNKEFSMYQLKCKRSEWPENYVVKGLNINNPFFENYSFNKLSLKSIASENFI